MIAGDSIEAHLPFGITDCDSGFHATLLFGRIGLVAVGFNRSHPPIRNHSLLSTRRRLTKVLVLVTFNLVLPAYRAVCRAVTADTVEPQGSVGWLMETKNGTYPMGHDSPPNRRRHFSQLPIHRNQTCTQI